MNGLPSSSNESFLKTQESLVQNALRQPKPINILQNQFDTILDKYNLKETARVNRSNITKPIILLNEEVYKNNSKAESSNGKIKKEKKRRSRKSERKLNVEEHDRALNEIKKIASIMDSNKSLNNKKGHSRVNSRSNLKLSEKIWGVEEEEDDDEYEIFIGHSSSSECSSKTSSTYSENDDNANNETENINSNDSIALVISPGSDNSLNNMNGLMNSENNQQKLVIPNIPNPMFNGLSASNLKKDVYFSRDDVFKKSMNGDDESFDSKRDELEDEEKRLNDKKKKSKLKQFLKLHRENCLLEMPNALYTDIISESIKILTKTSQNYTSQLGKKDESTVGSIKHLEHLKGMIPSGNQYQQHIDNNGGKFGPGYYQLCAPIDENGQYVQLKEKVLINSLESLNSIK